MQPEISKVSTYLKSISDPTRLTILYLLKEHPLCVAAIEEKTGYSQSLVSHQLSILKKQGTIVGDRQGKQVVYSLECDHTRLILDQLLAHVGHCPKE